MAKLFRGEDGSVGKIQLEVSGSMVEERGRKGKGETRKVR